MSRIIGQEVVDPQTYGTVYKVVVQATLLFGTESWVVSPRIRRPLGGFRHRVARRLKKMQPKRTGVGRWIYLQMDMAMKSVGIEEVETYVLRLQNTISQYILTWMILKLYLEAERRMGARVSMIW